MIKTHLIGLPIIGKKRELKFNLEKYINKNINEEKFMCFLKKFLKKNIFFQKKNVDIVSLGSFTYPDILISTLLLLNIINSKYLYKNSFLKSLINITRGNNNLKPFNMVKWFGTNFHYFIPKINKKYNNKIFDFIIKEDFKLPIKKKKKIVILGPFSIKYIFLKNNIKYSYKKIVKKIRILIKKYKKNVSFFQFEEPFFSDSLNKKHILIYKKIYSYFKKEKIMFVNYFSSIKKNIKYIKTYGLHIDLVSNKYSLNFIKKKIFKKFKKISLGIIDGKNILISNIRKILKFLKSIKNNNFLISTSCSLIHVPFDIKLEKKSSKLSFFSFFIQKVNELNIIKKTLNKNYIFYNKIKKNIKLNKKILKIKNEFNSLNIKKYKKKKFISLRKIGLNFFPTTTIGSFSQTRKIRKIRNMYFNKKISYKKYFNKLKKEIIKIIKIQEINKIDVLTNGEFERNDMVHFFSENIKGFYTTKFGWVQSYCTRCVKPPIIFKKINKEKIKIYRWIKFIKIKKPHIIKAIITGPITIFKWSFNALNIKSKNIVFQISKILKNKITSLSKKKNINIIQIDEPAMKEFISSDNKKNEFNNRKIIIDSFNFMCSNLKKNDLQIHTHICYSELSLYDIKMFKKMSIDVITIESSSKITKNSLLIKRYNMCKKMEVGLGICNVHSNKIPSVKKMLNKISKICSFINFKRIWINPDCGMKTRKKKEVRKILLKIMKLKYLLNKKFMQKHN